MTWFCWIQLNLKEEKDEDVKKSDQWKTNGRIAIIIILKIHITFHSIYHFESTQKSFKLHLKFFHRLCIKTIEARLSKVVLKSSGNRLQPYDNRLPVWKFQKIYTLAGGNRLHPRGNRLPHVKIRHVNTSWNMFKVLPLFKKVSISVYKILYIKKWISHLSNNFFGTIQIIFKWVHVNSKVLKLCIFS